MRLQRTDETWHRLSEWTNGQADSERLAGQVIQFEGFTNVDPTHPLGGPDGKKDAICNRGGERWIMAVYFPLGQLGFSATESKFIADLAGVKKNNANGIVFVTNQRITNAEREQLRATTVEGVEIIHLERLVTILDNPKMHKVREMFLKIPAGSESQGGSGGASDARSGGKAIAGDGGDAGQFGPGGCGGDAKASGDGSVAIGGCGGRGGVGPGGRGGDAIIQSADLKSTDQTNDAKFPRGGGDGGDANAPEGALLLGGEGGEAGQSDGRGGRGGRSASEILGLPESMNNVDGPLPGEGGRGAHSPRYAFRLEVAEKLRDEYHQTNGCKPTKRSINDVPLDWLNQKLKENGFAWRIEIDAGEYTFPDVRYDMKKIRAQLELHSPLPRGIALLTSEQITAPDKAVNKMHYDILRLYSGLFAHQFPVVLGNYAVFVEISGEGTVPLSLRFEDPDGTIVTSIDAIADNWGKTGSWQWIADSGMLRLEAPGVYFWRLYHGERVLLEKPIIVYQSDLSKTL